MPARHVHTLLKQVPFSEDPLAAPECDGAGECPCAAVKLACLHRKLLAIDASVQLTRAACERALESAGVPVAATLGERAPAARPRAASR